MAETDKEREKKRKEMDTDKDGSISPEERQAYKDRKAMEPDPLSKKELAEKYNYSLQVIYSNPELRRLFEKAVNAKDGQWTAEKFAAEIRNTDWYSKGKYWRQAWTSEKEGVEWKNDLEGATEAISRRATDLGASLSEKELNRLARRYLYEGWYDPVRATFLDNALSSYIQSGAVGDQDIEAQLRTLAWDYGVSKGIGDDWYVAARKRIAEGKATLDSLTAELRGKAVSKYAPFADSINNGQTTRQAAGMYTSAMSELLEMDENEIDLDDPLLKSAWAGQNGPDGKPQAMTVYDFETKVRQDPRWQSTGNGRRATMNLMQSFIQSLGIQR